MMHIHFEQFLSYNFILHILPYVLKRQMYEYDHFITVNGKGWKQSKMPLHRGLIKYKLCPILATGYYIVIK